MADYGCDYALWGVIDEAPPGVDTATKANTLEEKPPISPELRDAIVAWGADFWQSEGGTTAAEAAAPDERGFWLSRVLQDQLGPPYTVEFFFWYDGAHRERLTVLAESNPLPGWRIHQ